MPVALTVVNLDTARFECTFGRGCDGKCCQNGRPSLGPDEVARIDGLRDRLLPRLRPSARKVVEAEGFLSRRTKLGRPMLRVEGGWCVLFHNGCELHHLGAEDGASYQYKPTQCALFPLEPHGDGTYYVRQHGYEGERWDLFCLDPNQPARAGENLGAEVAYAAGLEEGERLAKNTQANVSENRSPGTPGTLGTVT